MKTPILATDAYKFAMAQAGFPLRKETFYFSFRRGGPQFIPFDLEQMVREMVSRLAVETEELTYAKRYGYGWSDAMEAAMHQPQLDIVAMPAGTWVLEREPIFAITGPSFVLSWLEPMVLWLNYPIQLATGLKLGQFNAALSATCLEQASIIERVAQAVGQPVPAIDIESEAYVQRVRETVRTLVEIVGTPNRLFEVGMRSVVCMEQHRLALQACKDEGILKTSNVHLARELDMVPVGTMGHEHVQRWGADLQAFKAMRDMRSAPPSYLLDTFDTMGSGIRAAIQVMREQEHTCSIRYDSGNKYIQYLHACELLREEGLEPAHVLEDALDVEVTRHFEALRQFTDWPEDKQVYGYGGHIVARPMQTSLTRDRVSAVYKLSETGGEPRMKFGNESGLGKQSIPGQPVTWRRLRGAGPLGIIAQAGETISDDYVQVSGNPDALEQLRLCNALDISKFMTRDPSDVTAVRSDGTNALIAAVKRRL